MKILSLFSKILGLLLIYPIFGIAITCFAQINKEEKSHSASDTTVHIDGSSTVYPLAEAVAEEFGKVNPGSRVTVGISGTGGGMKKFCNKEIQIANASRPIKASEKELCNTAGVGFIELPVAFDALTIVVNPQNTWADYLTVAELKKIWEPEAQEKITKWSQIRPGFPDLPLQLYGPGVDSGTFDYFTEAVVGKEKASRGDFTGSEDDNVLVQGISAQKGALGYFGLGYYLENRNRLKAVKIDDQKAANGDGPISPSKNEVIKGQYQPLSRPLFIYVRLDAADLPAVKQYVEFFLAQAKHLSDEVGYVELPEKAYELAKARFKDKVPGSVFAGGKADVGIGIEELMKKESN